MLRRHELSDQEKDNFSFVYSLFYVTNVKNTFSYLHEDLTQIHLKHYNTSSYLTCGTSVNTLIICRLQPVLQDGPAIDILLTENRLPYNLSLLYTGRVTLEFQF